MTREEHQVAVAKLEVAAKALARLHELAPIDYDHVRMLKEVLHQKLDELSMGQGMSEVRHDEIADAIDLL